MARHTITFDGKRTDAERRTKQAEKFLPWTGFAEVVKPVELRRRLVEQLDEGLRMNRLG